MVFHEIDILLNQEDLDAYYRYCMETSLGEEGVDWSMTNDNEIKIEVTRDFILYSSWAHIQN